VSGKIREERLTDWGTTLTNVFKLGAFVALGLVLTAGETWSGAPPTGVYQCYSARPYRGQIQIEVAPVVMFGLLDKTTYSDFDGKKGHYTYDGGTGILTMTDGSRQDWRYKRVAQTAFHHIDPQGKDTAYTCPLLTGKDPLKHPW
jgi:hypothetical protein